MRTIQLLDSQFNMNNKKLGLDVMKIAEVKGLIADEQYGSRKHRKASIAALNKRLTYDLLRQKRKCGALVINDAKSCYDRVAHNVAVITMRRMGATQGSVKSLFQTFQEATHIVTGLDVEDGPGWEQQQTCEERQQGRETAHQNLAVKSV